MLVLPTLRDHSWLAQTTQSHGKGTAQPVPRLIEYTSVWATFITYYVTLYILVWATFITYIYHLCNALYISVLGVPWQDTTDCRSSTVEVNLGGSWRLDMQILIHILAGWGPSESLERENTVPNLSPCGREGLYNISLSDKDIICMLRTHPNDVILTPDDLWRGPSLSSNNSHSKVRATCELEKTQFSPVIFFF